jgi:hypothetical protein
MGCKLITLCGCCKKKAINDSSPATYVRWRAEGIRATHTFIANSSALLKEVEMAEKLIHFTVIYLDSLQLQ